MTSVAREVTTLEGGGRPIRSLVLAPFFDPDAGNNRPRAVAAALARFGPVDVVTTSFDHARKVNKIPQRGAAGQTIVQLPTLSYHSNVGPARFRSHVDFARRAVQYTRARAHAYDVVYATAPMNLLAARAFAAVPSAIRILDVVDIWPDVLPFPDLVRRVGWPVFAAWKRLFADACRRADVLLAVSDRFLAEGQRWFRGRAESARRVYIGHPAFGATTCGPTTGGPERGRRRMAYVGNVGRLYDFEPLVEVLDRPAFRDVWELHIVGRGDRDSWLREQLARRGIAHVHHGVVSDPKRLGAILAPCSVGFNGYRNTTAAFSYKATTYLAAGLPLLNSMGGDLGALVRDRGLGANYREADADSLEQALVEIASTDPIALRERCAAWFADEIEATVVDEQLHAFLSAQLATHARP